MAFAFPAQADHAALGIGIGNASPISTETAITMPQGRTTVGVRAQYIEFDEFSDSELARLREEDAEADLHSVESLWQASGIVAHGITDDLTVGVQVPFIFRNNIREPEHGHEDDHDAGGEEPEIENLGDVEGIGDTTLFGQYRFFHTEENTTHASALFGVKMPTGKTSRRSGSGERLETELQPGTGSWDGLMGLAFTHIFGPFSFDTSVLYSLVTDGAQDTDRGDILSYNAALSYRAFGGARTTYMPPTMSLDFILELNGEWRDKEETHGVVDGNSGGTLLYLSPGVRFLAGSNWNTAFSFGIPIVEGLNGDQSDPDFRVLGSMNFNF